MLTIQQHKANLLWLDSTYPVDATGAGAKRGTCSTDSGVPKDVEAKVPNSKVSFSNIKFGPIGTTFEGGKEAGSPSPSKATSASPAPSKSASAGAQTKPQTTMVQSVKPSSAAQSPSSAAAEVPKVSSSQAAAVPSNKPAPTEVNTPIATDDDEEECEADPEDEQPTSVKPTAGSGPQPSAAQPSAAQPSSGSGSAAAAYQQCGGQGWTGATTCVSGYTCKEHNPWYSQCVASN